MIEYVLLAAPMDVFGVYATSRLSGKLFDIKDQAKLRLVEVRSRDERYEGECMVVPYEAVRGIKYVPEKP